MTSLTPLTVAEYNHTNRALYCHHCDQFHENAKILGRDGMTIHFSCGLCGRPISIRQTHRL